jgi:3-phenylpropionate/trans-cinnamate dioxygenase ferredoxin reductase component
MKYDVLIVGSGLAGVHVAVALRHHGYEGTIGLLGSETHPPYDRPPLSKGFLRGEIERSELALKSENYFAASDVDLLAGRTVTRVDPIAHTVSTADGESFGYGKLVWAAGGTPRRLSLAGAELQGVMSLRNIEDADRIRVAAASVSSAVIIGGGHIGLEVAAAFRFWGLQTTVLEVQERLLARVTSPVVSEFYQEMHRTAGVDIRLSASVSEIVGEQGRVVGVRLDDGSVVPAGLVIVGVGLAPNVEPLAVAGALCTNGVDVDDNCRTSLADIFALGDCANRRSVFADGNRVRLESVPSASEQAKFVANAILGQPNGEIAVPWFWSHQYETKLQTVGLLTGYDELAVRGDPAGGKFSVVYLRQGMIIALDCINNLRDFSRGKLLVAARTQTSVEAVTGAEDLKTIIGSVAATSA